MPDGGILVPLEEQGGSGMGNPVHAFGGRISNSLERRGGVLPVEG